MGTIIRINHIAIVVEGLVGTLDGRPQGKLPVTWGHGERILGDHIR